MKSRLLLTWMPIGVADDEDSTSHGRNKSFLEAVDLTLTGKEIRGIHRIVMRKIVTPVLFLIASAPLLVPTVVSCGTSQGHSEPLKVEIFSLTEGQKVRGAISIEARVNHPEEVNFVEFYFQEPGAKDRYSWMAFTPPYMWGGKGLSLETTLFDDGAASAVAFCFPKVKEAPMVQHRVHFVIDNGKPKVKIRSPQEGYLVKGKTLIQVDATDPKGMQKKAGITRLSIYLDGGLLKQLTTLPFQVELSSCLLPPGLHSIRAVAEDTEGLTGADAVMVEVAEQGSILVGKGSKM